MSIQAQKKPDVAFSGLSNTTLSQSSWHSLSAEESLDRLGSSTSGLSEAEASERFKRFGPNKIELESGHSALKRFLLQFHNLFIYMLLGAAVVTALLGHWLDTAVIFAVVIINALIGFIQEGKAEKALDSIRNMLAPHALVRRDGRTREIEASDLVPGDVVLLKAGDLVPADMRFIQSKSLQIEEAALTGESVPSDKSADALGVETALGDRTSMAFSGTLVTYGRGEGVVVATGASTEIGNVSKLLSEVQSLRTPLVRKLEQFARWLTIGIVVGAAATFAFGLLVRDYSASEMFLAAVGLAVAAIPEGLPAIMTITLAIGVTRMAKRNAIIRRLPAVETLGSVTVICSDKTGTLTRNEMFVQNIVLASTTLELEGSGYTPEGKLFENGKAWANLEDDALLSFARAILLCNDASLNQTSDGQWSMVGNPTDGALLSAALKVGFDADTELERFPRADLIPFDSEHKFMATLHSLQSGESVIFVKGAAEKVLEMSGFQLSAAGEAPLDKQYWQNNTEDLAARGNRVLAVAMKRCDKNSSTLAFSEVEDGLTLLGLVGLIDPAREEAIDSVKTCQEAGIQVKMITGDHAGTARAIAKRLSLVHTARVLTGVEIDKLDDTALMEAINSTDVFARTTPEHKLRLVRMLQKKGQIVAMTGDGVNDAPALKRADIGVAMGKKGTEAAKEASEMVLADDNFASIVHAVEEGRTVYDNLKKAIMFILPTNGGEALTIIAAIALGLTLPITPVQILWVNMITAVTLALALAFEKTEADVMRRPPRQVNEALLSGIVLWRLVFVSILMVVPTFGLYVWNVNNGASIELARTIAVNMLVFGEIAYLFNSRLLVAPSFTREGLLGSRPVLVASALVIAFQMLFTYNPLMNNLFGTEAVTAGKWLTIVLLAMLIFLAIELEKSILRRRQTVR